MCFLWVHSFACRSNTASLTHKHKHTQTRIYLVDIVIWKDWKSKCFLPKRILFSLFFLCVLVSVSNLIWITYSGLKMYFCIISLCRLSSYVENKNPRFVSLYTQFGVLPPLCRHHHSNSRSFSKRRCCIIPNNTGEKNRRNIENFLFHITFTSRTLAHHISCAWIGIFRGVKTIQERVRNRQILPQRWHQLQY